MLKCSSILSSTEEHCLKYTQISLESIRDLTFKDFQKML